MRSARSISLVAAVVILSAWALNPRPASAEIAGTEFHPVGPRPIDGFFDGGVTGRASAIAVNPENPDDVWIGTATGGVWHSIDGGKHWTPMTDYEKALAIGALALDDCTASHCATVYAGTGENAIRRDTYYGAGLLIGECDEFFSCTWTLYDGSPHDFNLASINDVVLDPSTSGSTKRLYVTLSSGVTTSASGATVTAPEPPTDEGYGIYMSEDRGATWVPLPIPEAEVARPTDLEIDPSDSDRLYAGFMGRGVFRGLRDPVEETFLWCPLNEGVPRPPACPDTTGLPDPALTTFDHVEIAIFPEEVAAEILYVTLGYCQDRLIQNCVPSIYKSMDGGVTWSEKGPWGDPNHSDDHYDGVARVYSRYTHALAVHPIVHWLIYLGGIRIWYSNDSGNTFTLTDWLTDSVPNDSGSDPILHLDHREIVFHPQDYSRVYSTGDGGFAYSVDGGLEWEPGNDTLQITGFQSISASQLSTEVLGGAQDNGVSLRNGGNAWGSIYGGDGGFAVMDRGDPDKLYAGTNFGWVMRRIGDEWDCIFEGLEETPRLFYAPIVQDPSPPHHLYTGHDRLFRFNEGSSTWDMVSPILDDQTEPQPEILTAISVQDHIENGGVNVITAIAVAPSDPDRIYVGLYGGEVWVTDLPCPDYSCWTRVDEPLLPDDPVTWIAVHPTLPDRAFVTFSGFDPSSRVWRTQNGGGSWTASGSGLPAGVPCNTISIEPSWPHILWLGTDSGPSGSSLYRSSNGGNSWVEFSDGIPNAPVYQISIREPSYLYVATHGRGAYVLGPAFIEDYENWVDPQIWDIPIFGQNFLPDQLCTISLFQSTGNVCAESSIDAMGGTVETDEEGVLVTSLRDVWQDKPVAWACSNGVCTGGVPIGDCNDDEDGDGAPDPLSSVAVACGVDTAANDIVIGADRLNPRSSVLGLDLPGPPGIQSGGHSFDLSATMQSRDDTRSLCSVSIPFSAGETTDDVLLRARDAVNDSLTCSASGVTALLDAGGEATSEDEVPRDARLLLRAPGLTGRHLITAPHAAPGRGTGSCFRVHRLTVPALKQTQRVKIRLETLAGGAVGGDLTVVERSGLGACGVTVATLPGQSAAAIAQALADAFQAPETPGARPACPEERNLRDITADGDALIAASAYGLQICSGDAAVGFSLRSVELVNVHPFADAGEDQTIECTGPSGARVVLDGSRSTDQDSTPGTQDDIDLFEWFEDYGARTETLLGTGVTLPVDLAVGSHSVTLRVTDRGGLTALDEVLIIVADTIPPEISVGLSPEAPWPPNHRMVDISAAAEASDICSTPTVLLNSVTSDEPDNDPGPGDGDTVDDIQDAEVGMPDFHFKLRAERDSASDGREYLVTYNATDAAGNATPAQALARVPHDVGGETEPLIISAGESAPGTIVSWDPVAGARWYNVIRGGLGNITETATSIDLGAVDCIESASRDESTLGNEDPENPALGEAFFYLVEYDDGSRCGYGTESAAKPRLVGSGDCM